MEALIVNIDVLLGYFKQSSSLMLFIKPIKDDTMDPTWMWGKGCALLQCILEYAEACLSTLWGSFNTNKVWLGNLFVATDVGDLIEWVRFTISFWDHKIFNSLICQDFSNPCTVANLCMYLEDIGDENILEFWQVPEGQWLELHQDDLVPSVLHSGKCYYIHEIATLNDRTCVILQLWLTYNQALHGDYLVISVQDRVLHVNPQAVCWIPIIDFTLTHDELALGMLKGMAFTHM